jgi:hypothetical protein
VRILVEAEESSHDIRIDAGTVIFDEEAVTATIIVGIGPIRR